MFPPEFERSLAADLGADAAAELMQALDGEPVASIRYNPFKLTARPSIADPVPWNRYGALLGERPAFTLDPAMHAGAYYVQEASSMFVEHLYRQAVGEAAGGEAGYAAGDMSSGTSEICDTTANIPSGTSETELPDGVRILDLCAAPGGKTTLYSTLAGIGGLVVANEVIKARASVLADNVRRWGIGNVAVSCNEARDFSAYKHWFDVLAVDAPCSGEGMFRKNSGSRAEWNLSNVELCAARQRKILAESWDALRPGGILIYSTCTFNRRENEENVAWLAANFAVDRVGVGVPAGWGVERGETAGLETFRLAPHKLCGEGFFAAVMRKSDGRIKRETPRARKEPLVELNRPESRPLVPWVAAPDVVKFARAGDNCYGFYRPQYQAVAALAGGLNIIYSGVCMGQVFGGKLRPDHALALFHDLAREPLNCCRNELRHGLKNGLATATELSLEQALDYLRKREFADTSILAEGLNLLTHNGFTIGWTKRIGHRTNTMLPNSFRIVNL